MPLYDISVPLSASLPCYPGDPPVELTSLPLPPEGAPFRISRLTCGSHSGTHLDAPAHLLPGGLTVDAIPLDLLLGDCRVLDLGGHSGDLDEPLLRRFPLHQRVLLRTRNSGLWLRPGFVAGHAGLTVPGAAWLVAQGVRLIGIDYLSIEAESSDGGVHRLLLEAGVVILEGLDLSAVAAGDYELLCLPLKLAGGDGAPCRTVLRDRG